MGVVEDQGNQEASLEILEEAHPECLAKDQLGNQVALDGNQEGHPGWMVLENLVVEHEALVVVLGFLVVVLGYLVVALGCLVTLVLLDDGLAEVLRMEAVGH